jgi:hypothetical protein
MVAPQLALALPPLPPFPPCPFAPLLDVGAACADEGVAANAVAGQPPTTSPSDASPTRVIRRIPIGAFLSGDTFRTEIDREVPY